MSLGAVDNLVNPREFFNACYHQLLRSSTSSSVPLQLASKGKAGDTEDLTVQEMCVKAMAAAYSAHAGMTK